MGRPAAQLVLALTSVLVLGSTACGSVVTGTKPWSPPDYYASEQYIEIDGVRVCYLEAGPPADRAETIVFVHGWSGNLQNWWDQYEHFQRDYHVVVFDAPGHGKSERGAHLELSMQLYVETLGGLLDALALDRVIMVGNSAGGWTAANFTIAHPERVSRLVLSDTTGTRHKGKVGGVLPMISARLLQIAKLTTGDHYPGLDAKSLARQQFAVSYAGTVEEAPYLDGLAILLPQSYVEIPTAALAGIGIPTLILWGDDDPVVPIRAMRTLSESIPDNQTYEVRLGGHTPMMNAPDEFNCAVDSFLAGRELGGCSEYALTKQTREDRLAGREGGPRYE